MRQLISASLLTCWLMWSGIGELHAAELRICNQTSYVLDTALAVAFKKKSASRGWFRLLPGTCSVLLKGSWQADHYYLHSTTPVAYRNRPEITQTISYFCVSEKDFLLSDAENCGEKDKVPFVEVVPDNINQQSTMFLTDPSALHLEDLRVAGLQRLLRLSGYAELLIDGVAGTQTVNALDAFRAAHNINTDTDDKILFSKLLATAKTYQQRTGFTLCNDSARDLIASIGILGSGKPKKHEESMLKISDITTVGWFHVGAGKCEKLAGEREIGNRVLLFAEVVDAQGRPVITDKGQQQWSGRVMLCTKSIRFEINAHDDCRGAGHDQSAFALYRIDEENQREIRLKD